MEQQEVRRRKKRFISLLLAMAVFFSSLWPAVAQAATFTANVTRSEKGQEGTYAWTEGEGDNRKYYNNEVVVLDAQNHDITNDDNSQYNVLHPGDKVTVNFSKEAKTWDKVWYGEEGGNPSQDAGVLQQDLNVTVNNDGTKTAVITVADYPAEDEGVCRFKYWSVASPYVSGGLYRVYFFPKLYRCYIRFETNGGAITSAYPAGCDQIDDNDWSVSPDALPEASKQGFSFEGWYLDEGCEESPVADHGALTVADLEEEFYDGGWPSGKYSVTLYAKYSEMSATEHAITYKYGTTTLNEAQRGGNPTTYTEGTGIESLSDGAKTGYEFGGWYSDPDTQNGDTKVTSISQEATDDQTLYAKFTPITYQMSYLDGDGNAIPAARNTNPATYTYAEPNETELADASPSEAAHQVFAGWYLTNEPEEQTDDTKVESFADLPYASYEKDEASGKYSIKLYAKFEPQVYYITWMYGDDDISESLDVPYTYTYGEGIAELPTTLPEDVLDDSNYDFEGWYTTKVEAEQTEATRVESISTTDFGDKKLYARVVPKTYDIIYHVDGQTVAASDLGVPENYVYGTGRTAAELEPTKKLTGKDHYDFYGWYQTSDCVGQTLEITDEDSGRIDLYGKYRPSQYDITYKDGETTLAAATLGNPASYTYGTGVAAADLKDAPAKEHYTFDGWYLDGTDTKVTKVGTTSSGAITLAARYLEEQYDITYKDGNATIDPNTENNPNPAQYRYGTAVTLNDASKAHYVFKGWYSTEAFSEDTKVTAISKGESGNQTFYAKFEPETYGITYKNGDTVLTGDANGGNDATYTYLGAASELKPAPQTDTHTFKGWYRSATIQNESTLVTAIPTDAGINITLYAKYDPRTFAIKYMDGETEVTDSLDGPTEYTYGTGISAEDMPVYEKQGGLEFKGWYSDAGFHTKVESISDTEVGVKTLYAKFGALSYRIHYYLEGEAAEVSADVLGVPEDYEYGTGRTETELVPTKTPAGKTYYDFDGWYKTDGYAQKVTGIAGNETQEVSLYGRYTPKQYSITYKDGETALAAATLGNPASYTYGTGVAEAALKDAEKEHFDFKGWYSTSQFADGTRVTEISNTDFGAKTLYAKFEGHEYRITYKDNETDAELTGAANGGNPATYTYLGDAITLNDAPDKDTYRFAGWYHKKVGQDEEHKLTGVPMDFGNDITLYAKYEPKTYSITYKDGETTLAAATLGNPASYTYGTGVAAADLKDAPAKEHYTFAGWYDGTTQEASKVTAISETESGAKTLYARFSENAPKTFRITYELGGGTVYKDGAQANAGDKYTVDCLTGRRVTLLEADGTKQNGIYREGYLFEGWYHEQGFDTKVTGVSKHTDEDMTVYAKWSDIGVYQISYELAGGENGAGNPTSYTYGEGVAAFADAAKNGEVFEGWYLDAGYQNKITYVPQTQTGDLVLYARFSVPSPSGGGSAGYISAPTVTPQDPEAEKEQEKPKKHTIQYELDGGTNAETNPYEYTKGMSGDVLEDPVKEGCVFEGWYLDEEFKIPFTGFTDDMGEVRLYAKFKKIRKAKESFTMLQFHSSAYGDTNITVKWKEMEAASFYEIYGKQADDENGEFELLATVEKGIKQKVLGSLQKDTYYVFYMVAVKKDGSKEEALTKSYPIYATTNSSEYGSAEKVSAVHETTIKKGKLYKLKAKEVNRTKVIRRFVPLRYVSQENSIAIVFQKGKVKAKKKGSCYVYVIAQNGSFTKVKIKVR